MIIDNKSIVPGILIKTKVGYFGIYYDNSLSNEDHLYILTEIKIIECHEHEHDTLVFYDLIEERFISVRRRYVERYIEDGAIKIVV